MAAPCEPGCACGKHVPFTRDHRRKLSEARAAAAARAGLNTDRESELNRERKRKSRALRRYYEGRQW